MKLTHVTGKEITEITRFGTWGTFLFFSECEDGAYDMPIKYNLIIDEDEIMSSDEIDCYDDMSDSARYIVEEFAEEWDIDVYDARDYIAEQGAPHEIASSDSYPDFYVDCQTAAAEIAKSEGFRGVRVADDTGYAYMICMYGRESELARVA